MKKIFMVLVVAYLLASNTHAQSKQSGVYLNLSDFENNKLTFATNTVSERNKIHFNEFFYKPFIRVNHNGENTIVFTDDIFAYKNKGNIVRSWNFISYNFIEKSAIWIYYKNLNISRGKGLRREKKYFYSTSGNSEIIPLTILNLKKSFPGNHLFHDLLDAQFRRDADLSLYDNLERKFKVNHLLESTISGISIK